MTTQNLTAEELPYLAHPLFVAVMETHREMAQVSLGLPRAMRSPMLTPLRRAGQYIARALECLDRAQAFRELDRASRTLADCAAFLSIEGIPRLAKEVVRMGLGALGRLRRMLEPIRRSLCKETHGDPIGLEVIEVSEPGKVDGGESVAPSVRPAGGGAGSGKAERASERKAPQAVASVRKVSANWKGVGRDGPS